MKLLYLSPSVMPSRRANSIHVMRMCEAFGVLGHEVNLVFASSITRDAMLPEQIAEYYGSDLRNVRLWPFSPYLNIGVNIQLAVFGLFVLRRLQREADVDVIVSRNLYASVLIGARTTARLVYEFHHPEIGWRRVLQQRLVENGAIKAVAISEALAHHLWPEDRQLPSCPVVLHDAAPVGIEVTERELKPQARKRALPDTDLERFRSVAGYFGHLYEGRGIELILHVAADDPNIAFLIFGGNDGDIKRFESRNNLRNVFIMGHVAPARAVKLMTLMDVLLMPHQRRVLIGRDDIDIAKWTSPMKMFEYMASGVPIIASKLPVLQEVLCHQHNALLAEPDAPAEWSNSLRSLVSDDELGRHLAHNARRTYLDEHNWVERARRLLQATT